MERNISIVEAKEIFGVNFIGPEESKAISKEMGIDCSRQVFPEIPFNKQTLIKYAQENALLILTFENTVDGKAISLPYLRDKWGIDPEKSEPCFYNQDWYLREEFYLKSKLEYKWNILHTNILEDTRGQIPGNCGDNLPSVLLCSYVFFAYFWHCKRFLWSEDYIWCSDLDNTGDRTFVGRYFDVKGISKNGFSIHRHLRVKMNYGSIHLVQGD
jgi:hypothetical protein